MAYVWRVGSPQTRSKLIHIRCDEIMSSGVEGNADEWAALMSAIEEADGNVQEHAPLMNAQSSKLLVEHPLQDGDKRNDVPDPAGPAAFAAQTSPADVSRFPKHSNGSTDGTLHTEHTSNITAALVESSPPIRLLDVGAHEGQVLCLVQLPGGLASGGADGTVRLWSVDDFHVTVTPVITLLGHSGPVSAICVVSATKIASGSEDTTVRVWDVSAAECVLTLRAHAAPVCAVASVEDNLASGSSDGTVFLWSLASGACLMTVKVHEGRVHAIAPFLTWFVTATPDSALAMWSSATLEGDGHISGHTAPVLALGGNHATLASGSADGLIKLWAAGAVGDEKSGPQLRCRQTLRGHMKAVTHVALVNDLLISLSLDGTVRYWSQAAGSCLAMLSDLGEGCSCILPLGNFVVTGDSRGILSLWGSASCLEAAAAAKEEQVRMASTSQELPSTASAVAEAAVAPKPAAAATIPQAFLCPITYELMEDPVMAADGHSYEREAITEWFTRETRSPMTNKVLADFRLIPNITLRKGISEFREAAGIPEPEAGIESHRAPTGPATSTPQRPGEGPAASAASAQPPPPPYEPPNPSVRPSAPPLSALLQNPNTTGFAASGAPMSSSIEPFAAREAVAQLSSFRPESSYASLFPDIVTKAIPKLEAPIRPPPDNLGKALPCTPRQQRPHALRPDIRQIPPRPPLTAPWAVAAPGNFIGILDSEYEGGNGNNTHDLSGYALYSGQWSNGRPHGMGAFYSPKRKGNYFGSWKSGVLEGIVEANFSEGSRYMGRMANFMPSGKGFLIAQSGFWYDGEFYLGLFSGKGSIFDSSGHCVCMGEFKSGEFVSGTCFHISGRQWRGRWSNQGRNFEGSIHEPDGFEFLWVKIEAGLAHGLCVARTVHGHQQRFHFNFGRIDSSAKRTTEEGCAVM